MQRPLGKASFVRRFDAVRSAVLRMRIVQSLCWSLFTAGASVVVLAAVDYAWELPLRIRTVALVAGMGYAAVVAAVFFIRAVLWWSRPRTAKELEAQFPQLGQRVRTVVQFSGLAPERVADEGVQPSLVTALEDETDLQTQPLDLREIVPRRKAIVAATAAVVPAFLLLIGLLWNWQTNMAIRRALLSDKPYTTMAAQPGDVLIDQGDDVTLCVTLNGRTNRLVSLAKRKVGDPDAQWQYEDLGTEAIERVSADGRRVEYAIKIDKVRAPFDYWFSAEAVATSGTYHSSTHHVAVRYPLALTRFEATLTPPRYTGVSPKTVKGGNLTMIEGSEIELLLEFDRQLREAYLLVSDLPYKIAADGTASTVVRVPLEPTKEGLTATLRLDEDKIYSIVATAREGGPLPENKYRIRIREDQTPRVRFEAPPVAWEVNPIAEVPMKIRVDDDFGLSKAGIVLQIDNGEEQPFVTREFSISVEPDVDGDISMTTRAALEKLLCLEEFPITETSAVTYYAYVEDNHPVRPNRAETDLRFIEIRPFQRFFKVGGT